MILLLQYLFPHLKQLVYFTYVYKDSFSHFVDTSIKKKIKKIQDTKIDTSMPHKGYCTIFIIIVIIIVDCYRHTEGY